jgi:hypothetical protein
MSRHVRYVPLADLQITTDIVLSRNPSLRSQPRLLIRSVQERASARQVFFISCRRMSFQMWGHLLQGLIEVAGRQRGLTREGEV